MRGSTQFNETLTLENQIIHNAGNQALEAIRKELPEEAQIYDVYNCVIEQCKELINSKKIVL